MLAVRGGRPGRLYRRDAGGDRQRPGPGSGAAAGKQAFVSEIQTGEPLAPADPDISLRIYYAQPGEELFDIARRFHVSPGQMLEANGLEPDTHTLAAACRLLVPGA